MSTALQAVAERLSVSQQELTDIVKNTIMPNKGNGVSNEQFLSFMSVANEHKLNPITKEIYAYPAKGGGIQPIVSIDGWLKIINSNPQFNGMEFVDSTDADGNIIAITCKIYRKDREHSIEVTEYLSECKKNSEPWTKWPSRMLRHKATIQAARYAFGLSGIIDPDEAERYQDAGVIEKDITPPAQQVELSDDEKVDKCISLISSGKNTEENMIKFLEDRGVTLTDDQSFRIHDAQVQFTGSQSE